NLPYFHPSSFSQYHHYLFFTKSTSFHFVLLFLFSIESELYFQSVYLFRVRSPLSLGLENSAGEETAKALPNSYIVKAFNTIFADMMNADKLDTLTVKPAGFYCGNNESAKAQVKKLIATSGFDPIDAGGIDSSRYLEQMAHLNIRLALSVENGTQAFFSYHRM
ncbi:MAG: hypothetical protein AAF984_08330, partial [Verrucomicrobiota bacterium]